MQKRINREESDFRANIAGLIRRTEQQANRFAAQIMVCIVGIYFLVGLAFAVGFVSGFRLSAEVVFINTALLFVSILVCWICDGKGRFIKYEMITVLLVSVFFMNLTAGYKLWMLYALPILITIRYYNERFTLFAGGVAIVLTTASAFANAYGAEMLGMFDLSTVSFAGGVRLNVTGFLYDEILAKGFDPTVVLKNTLRTSTLANCIVLVCLSVGCMGVIRHGQKLLLEAEKAAIARAEAETQMERSKLRILNTQLQPHFLYNTLSAIMAIDGNPDETVEALGEFGKYLRENLSSISENEKIAFSREIQHTRRYLSMEKLRFGDRLSVDYDMKAENFELPPLTVQLLAENAVKHGITKRAEGGHIRISSDEDETAYRVTVEDDGIGFDINAPIDTEKHVGLANLKSRLESICGGSYEIISSPGHGTKVIVRIPKRREGNQE